MHNNKFKNFYTERFGSGLAVATYFDADIADHAAQIGVNWSRVVRDLSWKNGKEGKVNASGGKLLPNFKASVGIYASLEKDDHGNEFPLVTFKSKGGAGDTVVFNGLEYIWELFKREKDEFIPQEKRDEWNKKKAERLAKATKQQEIARRKQKEENQRRAANVAKELAEFDRLPSADSFVYTDEKSISSIFEHANVRTGSDKYGNYIALKLQYIDGSPAGIQRIYDQHFTKGKGKPTNKDFTWGIDKDTAHIVLGDITSADRIYVVEGFATGASVLLAMQSINISCAVIVALDAYNAVKTVDAYQREKPYLPLIAAVDNDLWKQKEGKGNAGMLVALDLLAAHNNVKAYAPQFDLVDPSYKPTDFNDLHTKAGLKEVARQLKGNKSRIKLESDIFERALCRLQYVNFRAVQSEAVKCVQAGMQVGLPKYRPSDVIALIRDTAEKAGIPKNCIDLSKLAEKATKIFKAKTQDAQNFRSFSKRITKDSQRPEHITYKKFNKGVVDNEVLDYVKSLDGIVIVRFPMGSGKTQGIIKPVMLEAERAAFFAHRVSLIGGAHSKLNENIPWNTSPVIHYQESGVSDMLSMSNKLACCINSCIKSDFGPLLDNLNTLFIDEASQTLRHIASGGAVKYPVAVFNRMLGMISSTRDQVILADADANDTLVEFCELALKQRNAMIESRYGKDAAKLQKIHVIDGHTDCSDTTIHYTDADSAFFKVMEDVGSGHNVLVANDSAKDGEKLFLSLQEKYPEKKGLFVALDTKENADVDAFTDDPDGQSLQYDYLIYSPSISSGVSLENGHFNKHYGIFCGSVAPSDAIQMIRRDRGAREFVLGLSTMHSNREESANNMWLGLILANDKELNVNINKDAGTIEITSNDLDFDRFRLDLVAQENKAKNDFANNLLCILFADGYKLQNLDTSEIEQEMGKSMKDVARDIMKAIDMTRHLDQDTPTDAELENLLNKPNLSRDEKAQINRWNIEKSLMMDVNEGSVDFHHKGGMGKVRLFELLHMSEEKARDYDAKEIEAEVEPSSRLYLTKQREALRNFFEITGIDYRTGKGNASPELLHSAISHLIEGDNIHLFNNWYKFGGYINPFSRKINTVNKAKSILEALGLKIDTLQLPRLVKGSESRTRYSIKLDSWSLMMSTHQRRIEADVTSFKIDNLDGDLIQTFSDIYIDTEKSLDQPQATQTKAFGWIDTLKQAVKNLHIPIEYAPKIMTRLGKMGVLTQHAPSEGASESISRIYSELIGIEQLKN